MMIIAVIYEEPLITLQEGLLLVSAIYITVLVV